MAEELFPQFEEGTRVTGLGQTWTLGRVLGMGRCAKVYHMSTGEGSIQAAVKVYRKEEKYRLAFIKEVYNLDAVYGHRRVISVYGTFTHKGHPCLAMELLDFNLKEFIYQSENCQPATLPPPHARTSTLPSQLDTSIGCHNNNNNEISTTKKGEMRRGGGAETGRTEGAGVGGGARRVRNGRGGEREKQQRRGRGDEGETRRLTRQSSARQAARLAEEQKKLGSEGGDKQGVAAAAGETHTQSGLDSGNREENLRDTEEENETDEEDEYDDAEEEEEEEEEEEGGAEDVLGGVEDMASFGLSLYMMQRLVRDVASCLAFIQTCGWVHGDLKPANILWSSQEGSWKIVDFGHSFQEGQQDFSQIQSLCYQSPEAKVWNAFVSKLSSQRGVHKLSAVGEGVAECTHAADVWSLGCVVVGAFSGIKLYGQDDVLPGACRQCEKACAETACECEPLVDALFKPKMTSATLSPSHRAAARKLADLVKSMLQCDLSKRPSAGEILTHPFFSNELSPSAKDLLLLPMRTLRLSNLASSHVDLTNQKVYHAFYQDVKRECLKFGPIKTLAIPRDGPGRGMAFIEFEDSADAKSAQHALMGQKLFSQITLASYFPVDDFSAGHFY